MNDQQQIILQSKEGYFLKFDLEEIPEKKKNAVGVRGMKLTGSDWVEAVYYTMNGSQTQIVYGEHTFGPERLKIAKRDGRGTKLKL